MIRVIIFIMLCFSVTANAVEPIYLKCYLSTVDGKAKIMRFELEDPSLAQEPKRYASALAGKTVYKADGTTPVKVSQAYECVVIGKDFSSQKAKRLDSSLPQ